MKTHRIPGSPTRAGRPAFFPTAALLGLALLLAPGRAASVITINDDYSTANDGAITSGNFEFTRGPLTGYAPKLYADSFFGLAGGDVSFTLEAGLRVLVPFGVAGGVQRFNRTTTLRTTAENGVAGGIQYFQDGTKLETQTVGGVAGGAQHFFNTSSLLIQAREGVRGGTQTFWNNATAKVTQTGGLAGGSQTFSDLSNLEIADTRGLAGGTQTFQGNAWLKLTDIEAITGGVQIFRDNAELRFDRSPSASASLIIGGHQKFYDQSVLSTGHPHQNIDTISEGTQEFFDFAVLKATLPRSIQGGTQIFRGSSRLIGGASGGQQFFYDYASTSADRKDALSWGSQFFYGNSYLSVTAYEGIREGQQTFYDQSLAQIVGGTVRNGRLSFSGDSLLVMEESSIEDSTVLLSGNARAVLYANASLRGTQMLLRDNSEVLLQGAQGYGGQYEFGPEGRTGPGGMLVLDGHDLRVTRIDSPAGGGRITNGNLGGQPTLFVGGGDFGGTISDGVNDRPGGPLSLVVGSWDDDALTLSGPNTYSGFTQVTNGTLRLDFTRANSPVEHILNGQTVLLLGEEPDSFRASDGGHLELLGRSFTANRQHFAALVLAPGASTITLDAPATGNVTADFGSYANFSRLAGSTLDVTLRGASTALLRDAPGGTTGYLTMNGQTTWGQFAGNAIVPLTAYDQTWATSHNTDVRSDQPLTLDPGPGARTDTLRFDEAAANTVTLSGTATIEKGGILVTPNVGDHLTSVTGGTLLGDAGGNLVIIQANPANVLRIASTIGDGITPVTITKAGRGTLVLAGDNPYPGNFFSLEGWTSVEGHYAGNVTVAPGGSVGGNGTIGGQLQVGRMRPPGSPPILGPEGRPLLRPGRSPGELTAGSIELADGIYEWEINDALGLASEDPGWDLLTAVGILDITATTEAPFTIDIRSLAPMTNLGGDAANFDPLQDYAWVIASSGSGLSIGGELIDDLSDFSPDLFEITRDDFTNTPGGLFTLGLDPTLHDLLLFYTAPVPEPGTALFGLAVGATALLRRRRAA